MVMTMVMVMVMEMAGDGGGDGGSALDDAGIDVSLVLGFEPSTSLSS